MPTAVSAEFAGALEELLVPLSEPRWLVARTVVARPDDPAARRRLTTARAVGRPVDGAVVWHAVPSVLSTSQERVDAFAAAWQEHVGPARLVRTRDPEGLALLDALRGADPFGTTVRRLRTWT